MKARHALAAIGLLALGGCVVGEADIARELEIVQWDLRPLELETEADLRIGRGLIGMAATIASWSDDPDAELAAELLDGVDAVHVGAYELHGSRRHVPDDLTTTAREELEDLGWEFVVRTREGRDEAAWVMARVSDSRTEMLVVSLERDELVLVKIEGDPGRLLEAAIRRDREFKVATHSLGDEF